MPGQYTSTESAEEGWDLTGISCDDGNSSGTDSTATFNVEPGETVTCTFTNVKRGTITVVKSVQGGLDDEFCFNTAGEGFPEGDDFFCITTDGGTGEFTQDNLLPGTYGAFEQQTGQFILADSFCDDGSSPDSIGLDPGEHVTCTFINILPVAVPVNNVWALLVLTLMLLATGWYFRPASVRRS